MKKLKFPKIKIKLSTALFAALVLAVLVEGFIVYQNYSDKKSDQGVVVKEADNEVHLDFEQYKETLQWITDQDQSSGPDFNTRNILSE